MAQLLVNHRMRTLILVTAWFAASFAARAQLATTFVISSNDVVQTSIMVFHLSGTNAPGTTVKFAFTDSGAKRLEEFYRAHAPGDEVSWQCGNFVRRFKLDDRKFFGREGFWGLSEADAKTLEAGLRGSQ